MPNKLSKFWQELKRRNVTRVIAVYIAAAFMILELINMFSEPLGLPERTLLVAFFISIAGLVIAVIVSWVYDIQPEGGIIKAEPADKVKDLPISSNSWRIASYISFVVIVGLIVLNIIPRFGKNEILDKSVVVLPFTDDSPEGNNAHIINGIMGDLLINLQSIKQLRVPGHTSTEQYRNNPKSIQEIASEMKVSYVVGGSGQRYADRIRLRVWLVEGATDRQIWADSYDEVINDPEDIFRIQSEIAQSIADELQALITTEEKQLISKVPTTSLTAWDYYQRARQEHINYRLDRSNKAALDNTEINVRKALELDPSYALAYSELAWVYFNKRFWETYFSDDFLDTVLILADKALSYDNQLAEAYVMRGNYYRESSQFEKSLNEYNKAIELNPNIWEAYSYRGWVYMWDLSKYDKALEDFYKAASLHRGSGLPMLLSLIGLAYGHAGFLEKAEYYIEEKFKLDGDEDSYLTSLGNLVSAANDHKAAQEFFEKVYSRDSTNIEILQELAWVYQYLNDHKKSLEYWIKYEDALSQEEALSLTTTHRVGYAYWKNGLIELAEIYFQKQLDYCLNIIQLGRSGEGNSIIYYDLAAVYAFRGEAEKAIENLKVFNRRERMNIWLFELIKKDPLFDNIRHEPEFQQIVRDVEAKYQAERERVRQWLEANDML